MHIILYVFRPFNTDVLMYNLEHIIRITHYVLPDAKIYNLYHSKEFTNRIFYDLA